MKSAPAFDLVALGDPVLDVVVRTDELPRWDDKHLGLSARLCAGGSEANAACAASRLGLRVTMFGQLGDGAECDFLLSELECFGVESTWLARRSGAATATAIIHVGDGGERAITYVPVHDDRDRSGELHTMLSSTRCVYHVPYDVAALERLAAAARTAGTTIAVDIERAVAASPGVWSSVAGCADLIFLNESGFAAVTGRMPTLDAARALHRATGARALVVTLGALGALAVDDRDAAVAQGAFQSRVIDATGAGDCFNGAFVAAFLQGAELPAALAQGCAAACLCVESPGARAPGLDAASVAEVQRLRPTVPIKAALEART